MTNSQSNLLRLYNTKILVTFWQYLRDAENWSEAQMDQLMRDCGKDLSFLKDDSEWFDQKFADKFYDLIVQRTGDNAVAYKVGVHFSNMVAQSMSGQILRGFLSPETLFKRIKQTGEAFSKGAILRAIAVKPGLAIVRAELVPGCDEKEYQCENRRGYLQYAPTVFGAKPLGIKHTTCRYKGDNFCEYEISWAHTKYRLPMLASMLTFLALMGLFPTIGLHNVGTANSIIFAILIYLALKLRDNIQIRKLFDDQNEALTSSIKSLERKYEQLTFVMDIINSTTRTAELNVLLDTYVSRLREIMNYDRIIIFKLVNESNVLKAVSYAGLDNQYKDLIENIEFAVRPDNDSGFLVKVVNTKSPLLISDVKTQMHLLSEKSQKFVKWLGVNSFVACPIAYKGEIIGVLTAEITSSSRALTNEDKDFLSILADHLAITYTNSRYVHDIQKTLRQVQAHEQHERRLKETFKKYVPAEVQLLETTDNITSLQGRRASLYVASIDIVGFTSISESLQVESITMLLNTYITFISSRITKFGGTINKIMGDGLLIYFHEESKPVAAFEEILENLSELNNTLSSLAVPNIALGIGAHFGECILGNIGSSDRVDYTLIGDAVNIAARIESFTRQTGPNTFCISDQMFSVLQDEQAAKFFSVGNINLKGKAEPVKIHQFNAKSITSLTKAS